MGLKLFSDSRGDERGVVPYAPEDPRPHLFKIRHLEEFGEYVIGVVNYPNCPTFDGDKIIVWRGKSAEKIRAMKLIDPHFLHDNNIIARFRPTADGWYYAKQMVMGNSLTQSFYESLDEFIKKAK